MNGEQIKVIAESITKGSTLGTVNALEYVKAGIEAYRKINSNVELNNFINFMSLFLNEAIEDLNKKIEM